jgi:preprotein translocase subunit SecG
MLTPTFPIDQWHRVAPWYTRTPVRRAFFKHEARTSVKNTLRVAELILAVSLITLILMQSRGTSLGSVFGQEGSVFHTRRGAERILFNVSIGVALGFLIISVALAHVNV